MHTHPRALQIDQPRVSAFLIDLGTCAQHPKAAGSATGIGTSCPAAVRLGF
eukprot:SAG31_NODE_16192_length_716_cov_1.096774_1_plen_50_part_10